jgi:tetratricopeptide (TPR) repeat protein
MSKRARAIEDALRHAQRLFSAGQTPQAAQVCQQILGAAPGHPEALHMLGLAALRLGQPETADACLADAIARKPGAAALFHAQRGLVLLELGRPADAEAACRAALALKPGTAEALQCLGHALFDQRRPEEAVAAYREALRLKPSLADIQNNLAMALREADQPDEAERWFRAAARREPRDVTLRGNLASLLRMEGRLEAAEIIYREALRLDPDDAVQRYNLGILLLLAGRLAEGWAEYEYRFQARATPGRSFPQPLWSGEPLAGRTLLVHAEQGFGDTIQFCRYLPLLAKTGRVVLEAQGRLLRLLSSLPGDIQLVRAGETLPAFDLHCPLLGLPARCGTTLDTIPADVPYLHAEDTLVARWRERLGPEGFKVGICWQGNPGYAADRSRSIALEHFRPLADVPGVRLISLQKTNGVEQLGRLAAELRIETLGDALDAGPDGFVDTAAIMQSLDLVITSDTAIPHLAGALGRPVWMALAKTPDWRWLLDRPDCPWYPTMRLFRQGTRGDWPGVFAEIAGALTALASSMVDT